MHIPLQSGRSRFQRRSRALLRLRRRSTHHSKVGRVKVSPVAQVLISERTSDGGGASTHPVGSGYERALLSRGLEVDVHRLKFYADAEVPVYQNFTGNQLAAPVLIKATISYEF